MYNDILTIHGHTIIYGYGLMISIGCLCAVILAQHRAKRKKLDVDFIFTLFIYCVLAGFLGAKLLYCIVDFENFIKNPLMIFTSSGFVVYGGIICGILCGYFLAKRKKYNFLEYLDVVIPSIPLAQGFGRIGCFLAGCCYGRETNSIIGVQFPIGSMAPSGVSLIPTQLFSAIGDFGIALLLILLTNKVHKRGTLGVIYVYLYAIGRFVIEFFRADYRGDILFLTTSQFISFILIMIVTIFLICKKIIVPKKL